MYKIPNSTRCGIETGIKGVKIQGIKSERVNCPDIGIYTVLKAIKLPEA